MPKTPSFTERLHWPTCKAAVATSVFYTVYGCHKYHIRVNTWVFMLISSRHISQNWATPCSSSELLRLLYIGHWNRQKMALVKWNGKTLYPVKVVERRSELIHLLLTDALSIPGQDLGLNLIDSSGDGCEEQLPPNTDVLCWQTRNVKRLWKSKFMLTNLL